MKKRFIELPTIVKLFIVMREQLCSADFNHSMRKHFSVEQMERYTKYVDRLYNGNIEWQN